MSHMAKERKQYPIRFSFEEYEAVQRLAALRQCSVNAILACFVSEGIVRSRKAYRENNGKTDRLPELPNGKPSIRERWEEEGLSEIYGK